MWKNATKEKKKKKEREKSNHAGSGPPSPMWPSVTNHTIHPNRIGAHAERKLISEPLKKLHREQSMTQPPLTNLIVKQKITPNTQSLPKCLPKVFKKAIRNLCNRAFLHLSGLLFGPHHILKLITLIKVVEKLCGVKKATPKSFSITSLNNWINQGSVFTCNNGNVFSLVPLHEQINCILKRFRIK